MIWQGLPLRAFDGHNPLCAWHYFRGARRRLRVHAIADGIRFKTRACEKSVHGGARLAAVGLRALCVTVCLALSAWHYLRHYLREMEAPAADGERPRYPLCTASV